ncbi:hypothetical protein [Nocardioides litoris]|uniref:hypothetical protein n=1 Tax=Nocardioides litoris TaxID=1926648 RepID=UPI001476DF59|nr:hypothetical protein [Nocardioides litoris]
MSSFDAYDEDSDWEDGELATEVFAYGGLIALGVGVLVLVLMAAVLVWMSVQYYG